MAAAGHSPLEQFTIVRIIPIHLGRLDLSYTNAALLMTIAVALATLLLVAATARPALVPSRLQSVAELLYEFVAGMVRDNVGDEGRRYFPLVFSIFIFILFGNLLGLVPYSFTFTGQIIVTFALALTVFIGVTLIGIALHGVRFLTLFVPAGVPKVLLLLLVPIEVLSYFIRPFTLAIRLFANMMAGHTMLAIFATFVTALGIAGILPLAVDVALIWLELLVAVLQAYVFAILTCLYLADALHLH